MYFSQHDIYGLIISVQSSTNSSGQQTMDHWYCVLLNIAIKFQFYLFVQFLNKNEFNPTLTPSNLRMIIGPLIRTFSAVLTYLIFFLGPHDFGGLVLVSGQTYNATSQVSSKCKHDAYITIFRYSILQLLLWLGLMIYDIFDQLGLMISKISPML